MVWQGKQVEAILDETRELDIEGALRASKTTICLRKELKAAVREPGIQTLLARWTDDSTHGILKPVWRKLCGEAGIPLTWNGQEQYDELPNGSRVYVRGLKSQDQTSRYSKFRGLTLARIYIDQAEEIPKDIYLELAARLSQKGHKHQITISPNAVEENHWIAHEFPEENTQSSRKYISLSVHDNAHNLPPEVIPNLERLYPVGHPKHRTMVLGLRGMNVIGDPVYAGAFVRTQHEQLCAFDPELPLDEAIDFGKHHPCVIWRQTSPLGQVRYLGGILGQDMYLEDFLPIVLRWRGQWFPQPCEVRTCCDPAGASDNSQGVRDNGVRTLQKFEFSPTWRPNANAPDVRLNMVERTAGLMRISTDQVVQDHFLADGFEAGYVWDEHMVSVGSKQIRKPKKDGWYEHGQNCSEYLELTFDSSPVKPKRRGNPFINTEEYGDRSFGGRGSWMSC